MLATAQWPVNMHFMRTSCDIFVFVSFVVVVVGIFVVVDIDISTSVDVFIVVLDSFICLVA